MIQVNINKQKKDAFHIIKPDFDAIAESSSHFDPRMGINKNKLLRPKRPSFQFVEEGQMSKMADIQRIKVQRPISLLSITQHHYLVYIVLQIMVDLL